MDCYICEGVLVLLIAYILYYIVIPFLLICLNHFVRGNVNRVLNKIKTYGKWVVVTGSTDGIGKAYAFIFAKAGLNIVLISRNPEKLNDVSEEIKQQCNVETMCITADFTKDDIYDNIKEQLDRLDVAALVNNVGVCYPYPTHFFEDELITDQFAADMLNCNCLSLVGMTQCVLPRMVEKGGGAIINVGSSSGNWTAPLMTLYAASKAFVQFFSRAVAFELRDTGVSVQTVSPFWVATRMSGVQRATATIPSPTTYVAAALAVMNVEPVTFGCFAHAVMGLVFDNLPERFINWYAYKLFWGIREKYLSRQKQRKEQ